VTFHKRPDFGNNTSNKSKWRNCFRPKLSNIRQRGTIQKIIRLINENIADPDLNVEFPANGVGMGRVHMHRKLKEFTNQSARDFIRTIRLNQAAELLKNQKLTVSEVAYALGYANLSHFSNSFREFHGMSPKEFKEKDETGGHSRCTYL
jgi:AraC-like DNA-binding protein